MEGELNGENLLVDAENQNYEQMETGLPVNEYQQHEDEEPANGAVMEVIMNQAARIVTCQIDSKEKITTLLNQMKDLQDAIAVKTSENSELQKNIDEISELYKLETTCGREELEEKFESTRQCIEALSTSLENVAERFNSFEMDKNTMASVQLSYYERINAFEQATEEKELQTAEMYQLMHSEIETLEKQLKEHERVIATKEIKIEEITNKSNQTIAGMKEELKVTKNNLAKTIEDLQSKLSKIIVDSEQQLQNQKTTFENQIKDLHLKIEQYVELNQQLNAQLSEMQLDVATHKEESAKIEQELELRINHIQEQEVQIKSYQSKLEESLPMNVELQEKLDDLQNNEVVLQKQVDDLKAYLEETQKKRQEEVENQLKQWKITEEELKTKSSADQIKISDYEKQTKLLKEDIIQIQETHKMIIREYRETMQRNESDYSQKLKDAKTEVTNLETKLESTRKEKQSLEKQISAANKELECIKLQSQNSDKLIKSAEEEKIKLKRENTTLRGQLSQVRTRESTQVSISQDAQPPTRKRKQVKTQGSDFSLVSEESDSSDASIHIDPQLIARRAALMARMSSGSRFSDKKTFKETNDLSADRGDTFSVPDSSSSQTGLSKQMRLRKSK